MLTACSAALLAGCDRAAPKLERTDAASLVALAHRVPGEDACAQTRDIRLLQRRAISLVNAGRVPTGLQEPLMSGVAALAAQAPVCLPSVPVAAPTPPTPPAAGPAPRRPHGEAKRGHPHGHGHDKGARKGKK